MNPPGVQETLELSKDYGIANVLLVIVILAFLAAFFLTLRWVFKTTALREAAMSTIITTGMQSLTNTQLTNTTLTQQIAQNMKDGFDVVSKACEHQRREHADMLNIIKDYECKATKS